MDRMLSHGLDMGQSNREALMVRPDLVLEIVHVLRGANDVQRNVRENRNAACLE